jgi:hypothetical protein
MNVIQKIATQIVGRVEQQAKDQLDRTGRRMGQKAKNQINLDMWAGAVAGLAALNGDDDANTKWALRVLTMVVWPRGYSETQKIANEAREAERIAALDVKINKELSA